jgi:hypothetical protein
MDDEDLRRHIHFPQSTEIPKINNCGFHVDSKFLVEYMHSPITCTSQCGPKTTLRKRNREITHNIAQFSQGHVLDWIYSVMNCEFFDHGMRHRWRSAVGPGMVQFGIDLLAE